MTPDKNESEIQTGKETIAAVIKQAAIRLRQLDIDTAELDARLLMQAVADLAHSEIIAHGDRQLEPELQRKYRSFIDRRLAREPVHRIIGRKEFWGLELDIPSPVLEPRADTECLVEAVLNWVDKNKNKQDQLRIADIGTGSGAIIIALMSELKNSIGVAIDLSKPALKIAKANAEKHGLEQRISFEIGSFCGPLSGLFDVIVSNPPYIPTSDIAGLSQEVQQHDPALALDGGADGLDAYRILLGESGDYLRPSSPLFLEIGFDQAGSVGKIASELGWHNQNIVRDLNGKNRVFYVSC